MRITFIVLWIGLSLCTAVSAQTVTTGEVFSLKNSFTQPGVIPKGCLIAQPAFLGLPDPSTIFFDQTFSVSDGADQANVRIRSWRIGCHEPARSAIAVNFKLIGGDPNIDYPLASLILPGVNDEVTAGLFFFGLNELVQVQGESLRPMIEEGLFEDGVTLVVDLSIFQIDPAIYNGQLVLRLLYSNGVVDIPVPEFEPTTELTQTPLPAFNGRYSGQWVVQNLPRTGLVLQFGELPGQVRQFVFAVWFTYLNGEPFWVVGNVDMPSLAPNEIDIEMFRLEGGQFITEAGSFAAEDVDVESIGTMKIRAVHCNKIEADLDFGSSGLGTSSLEFDRLIRIAGHDCDQTQ